jgi:hypothetical protein
MSRQSDVLTLQNIEFMHFVQFMPLRAILRQRNGTLDSIAASLRQDKQIGVRKFGGNIGPDAFNVVARSARSGGSKVHECPADGDAANCSDSVPCEKHGMTLRVTNAMLEVIEIDSTVHDAIAANSASAEKGRIGVHTEVTPRLIEVDTSADSGVHMINPHGGRLLVPHGVDLTVIIIPSGWVGAGAHFIGIFTTVLRVVGNSLNQAQFGDGVVGAGVSFPGRRRNTWNGVCFR